MKKLVYLLVILLFCVPSSVLAQNYHRSQSVQHREIYRYSEPIYTYRVVEPVYVERHVIVERPYYQQRTTYYRTQPVYSRTQPRYIRTQPEYIRIKPRYLQRNCCFYSQCHHHRQNNGISLNVKFRIK